MKLKLTRIILGIFIFVVISHLKLSNDDVDDATTSTYQSNQSATAATTTITNVSSLTCWQDEAGFLHNCPNGAMNATTTATAGGVHSFFPKQCSVKVALERLSNSSMEFPPMGRMFLPSISFYECNSDREELDTVLSNLFFQRNNETAYFPIDAGCGRQTMGKQIDWCIKHAMLSYMARPHESNKYGPPWPEQTLPREGHWSRHLHCAPGAFAWDCMTGNHSATPIVPGMITQHDETMKVARHIWNMRKCIFTKQCGDASYHHVRTLLLGWTYRYTLPFNACNAKYRMECQSNIVSLRNLDPTKITHRVFLSIHMRMGDACDRVETMERLEPFSWGKLMKSRPCILPEGYELAVDRMTAQYHVTDILLASDSESAFEWARGLKSHDIHYLDMDRGKLDTHDKGWIELRNDLGHGEVDGALQEWNFLGNGQMLIGGSCGKFTKVLYNIMVGRQNSILPWVSVDGCSCFHDDDQLHCK
mmetsp:Transcript_17419/g.36742  ORF Transcript_17419/g.36742 Transcript_17419/m.36742 type:complete len:476 (+) Transcript_17419:155-1582(+)